MAKGKGVPPIEGETTRQRSVRLATKRVSALLKYMDLVGNLYGVGYQLSEDDKAKIKTAIDDGNAKLSARMEGKSVASERFKL